jgi:hypothetical protein
MLNTNRTTIFVGMTVVSLCIFTSIAYSRDALDFPVWLSNKNKLKNETWQEDAPFSALTKAWPTYDGEQGIPGKVRLKKTELVIEGIRFHVEQHKYENDGTRELIALNLDSFPESFCRNTFSKLTTALGVTKQVVETSRAGYEGINVSWQIGNSTLRFECSGVKMPDSYTPGIASFQVGQKSKVKQVQKLSYIQCSGTGTNLSATALKGYSESYAVPAFTLSIDPNRQTLCREGSTCYPKEVQFSDLQIEYKDAMTINSGKGNEGVEVEDISIDRQNGSYRDDIQISPKYGSFKGEVIRISESGTCRKTDGKTKF